MLKEILDEVIDAIEEDINAMAVKIFAETQIAGGKEYPRFRIVIVIDDNI